MNSMRRDLLIIETGSSAWGVNSTALWSVWIDRYGGAVTSIDIRSEPSELLSERLSNVEFRIGDSVKVLHSLPNHLRERHKLVYLDSMDLDFENPWPSMRHGLNELNAIQRLLKPGDIVLIDDTPLEPAILGENLRPATSFLREHGFMPGKGALILRQDKIMSHFSILYHHYNVVLRVN